ncbi:hypothetical protein [Phenylobacterium sp.]|uniref:hypothetical protein n=1 Tax=Phenylobacterium sp. TaxID=1871053 RepID=UPI00120AFBF9|nr:hypothetical protein [Phenylobacterium sp.]THD63859.1 MAG: hypothetical protein E8A49_04050 [Phenylobacterium sp.]
MVDLILKFVTLATTLVGGIAVYIAVRNNSHQIGVQIFLTYSERVHLVRETLSNESGQKQGLTQALHIVFEFHALRKAGFIAKPIWAIWEADITRLFCTPLFRRHWPDLREGFDTHPDFIAWVEEPR